MSATTIDQRQAPMGPLLLATFLMASANLAVFPLLADLQEEHGLPTAALGPIAGAAFVAAVVAQLLVAPQADRGRERHLLVGGLLAAALALVAMAAATDAVGMVLARALEGLAYGAFVPAARAIVTRGAGLQVGERLGRLSAAELAGVAGGPLLSAWLASAFSVDVALLAFAVLAVATVPLVLRLPIERTTTAPPAPQPPIERTTTAELDRPAGAAPPGPPRPVPGSDPDAEPSRALGPAPTVPTTDGATVVPAVGRRQPALALDLLRERSVVVAVLLSVALMVPVGAYDPLWSRYMTDLGASTVLIGVSLAAFALPYIVLATAAGRATDRIGALRASVIGMLISTAVMVAYGLAGNPWLVTALASVESTGQALAGPGAQAAMAHATGEERAGAGQGLAGAIGMLAAGSVAVVAAPVYEAGGAAVLFGGTAAVVVAVLATAVVLHRATPPTATAATRSVTTPPPAPELA